MKAKGIVGSGTNRGDIIEYAPKDKVPHALGYALVASDKFDGYVPFVTDVKVEDLSAMPSGDLLNKRYQNNTYRAAGTAKIHRKSVTDSSLMEGRDHKFTLEFCDCLDDMGYPDVSPGKLTVDLV